MSTATIVRDHIAHELIESTNRQVVLVEFVSPEITGVGETRELATQLGLLIRPQLPQYFVIDCGSLRSLGSAAFGEILSFVQRARAVWICNLDSALWCDAFSIGLNNWVRCAANRHLGIAEAQRTARWDEEDSVSYFN
jgi:hypothetical protein